MENPHPSIILRCSATELESAVASLLYYQPTLYTKTAIRRAAARLHGHSIKSNRYPVPAHLLSTRGQYGILNSATQTFKTLCSRAYSGTLLRSNEYKYLSDKIIRSYIKQITIYSDINKLRNLLEKHRAQK